ncbi:MAG: ROK family protein [Candidatus Zhuqueibacterota bacterium]
MNQQTVIGVDFGGTKIKFGAVTASGELTGKEFSLPTLSHRPRTQIIDTIIGGIERAIHQSGRRRDEIGGIGIGSPGPLDLKSGTLLNPPNLPTLHNFPMKAALENHFHLPVKINNDGNCFALGEAYFGSARSASIVCGVTLGTGFGCGIVIDQKIYSGATGTAAEVWCSPYADRNFEEYGSARAVNRIYESLTGISKKSRDVFELAVQGDAAARTTWAEFGSHLGRILAIIVNILDPDIIVIGGSVSNAWQFFSPSLVENLHGNINPAPRNNLSIVHASLGDNAGLLGAAALLFSDKH